MCCTLKHQQGPSASMIQMSQAFEIRKASMYRDHPFRTSRGTGHLFQPGEISFQNAIRIHIPVVALNNAKKSMFIINNRDFF